jgi:hypothetical protein
MKLDLIFFDEEMLVSKKTKDWTVWQEKLYYYKASIAFDDKIELFEYLKIHYMLTDKDIRVVDDAMLDKSTNYFLIDLKKDKENEVKVTKTSLDFLGNKGELVYWKEWYWTFSKVQDDFYLWAYLGGIAEMAREIKLSDKQKSDFYILGKPFIEKLAEQLQVFKSTVYSEAITEGRKIL